MSEMERRGRRGRRGHTEQVYRHLFSIMCYILEGEGVRGGEAASSWTGNCSLSGGGMEGGEKDG